MGRLVALFGAIFAAAAALAAVQEVTPERARALEHLLVQDCGSCHGMTLKGGLGSPLTRDAIAHYQPETLALVILDGVPGTAMPPWRPLLNQAEAMWIAGYLQKGRTE